MLSVEICTLLFGTELTPIKSNCYTHCADIHNVAPYSKPCMRLGVIDGIFALNYQTNDEMMLFVESKHFQQRLKSNANRLKQTRPPKPKFQLGSLGLIFGLLATAVIGYLLNDALNLPHGIFGGLVWSIAFGISFLLGLLYYAQFLLPLKGMEGWSEGFNLLTRFYFQGQYPSRIRPLPTAPPSGNDDDNEPPKPLLPPSFLHLQAGMVPTHYAISLMRGIRFSRPSGPGFVMLGNREYIDNVIDLRTQLRSCSVEANTRDGIPISTNVTAIFRVKRAPTNENDRLYPYDREAIFHIYYAHSIDTDQQTKNWSEMIAPRAAAILIEELAQHHLNDLFQDDSTAVSPFEIIKQAVKRRLEQQVSQNGIELLAVGMGHLQMPEQIIQQRIQTWQSGWAKQIRLQRGAGDAETVRRRKSARARAQIEIINHLTHNIDAMRQAGQNNLPDIVMLRTIQALEEATTDPMTQSIIPTRLMDQLVTDASDQIQTWMDEGEDDHD